MVTAAIPEKTLPMETGIPSFEVWVLVQWGLLYGRGMNNKTGPSTFQLIVFPNVRNRKEAACEQKNSFFLKEFGWV